VNRRFIMAGAILGLVAMVFFVAWPVWKWIVFKPVSAAVEKNPRLQPAWDIASKMAC
jgi:hypothetical protein